MAVEDLDDAEVSIFVAEENDGLDINNDGNVGLLVLVLHVFNHVNEKVGEDLILPIEDF